MLTCLTRGSQPVCGRGRIVIFIAAVSAIQEAIHSMISETGLFIQDGEGAIFLRFYDKGSHSRFCMVAWRSALRVAMFWTKGQANQGKQQF